jgi:hypothetical protein
MATTIQFTVPLPPVIVQPEITYVAETVPAKPVRVSDTTLFRVALDQFGDPLKWGAIAEANDLIDPWIVELVEILVPPVAPTGQSTGIYAPVGALT